MDTKEKILQAALRLFAKDGYEGVSVRKIAEKLGITKGALYKHYKNKQDIFDSIVNRMEEIDAKRTKEFNSLIGNLNSQEQLTKQQIINGIKQFSIANFKYWTEDEFAANFRKILTLEQYRNPQIAKLLNKYLTNGVIKNAQVIMARIFVGTKYEHKDTNILALNYFGPIYLLMGLYDQSEDKASIEKAVVTHIDYFMESFG